MKGILILDYNNEMGMFDYNLCQGVPPFDYEIHIKTDLADDFVSLISNTKDLDDSIDNLRKISNDEESIIFYEQCKGKKLELLQNAEYVSFGPGFSLDRIAKYVKDNPILKTKKILFTGIYDLDPKIIVEIEKTFGSDTSNIYFDIIGNSNFINIEEYEATLKVIENMVKDVERFNFSPLEKIMYAYDLVRKRIYVEESKNEDKTTSRDLTPVLLGDKIVCAGYSVIFQTLLQKLGIKSRQVILAPINKTTGHARNQIYVKDEKYGIDGVYYFDPTWDSKKNENDNTYLKSYKFFAMTRELVDFMNIGKYIDIDFPYFSSDIMWELEDLVEERGFENLPPDMIKSINYMSKVVNGKLLINKVGFLPNAPEIFKTNKDKIVNELITLVERFNSPLSEDTLLKVIYNVRKAQHQSNPQEYPMDENYLFQIETNCNLNFNRGINGIFNDIMRSGNNDKKHIN